MILMKLSLKPECPTTKLSRNFLFIAQNISVHTMTEKLVKPVSKLMINIMLGEKVKWAFGKNVFSKPSHWRSCYCYTHAVGCFVFW